MKRLIFVFLFALLAAGCSGNHNQELCEGKDSLICELVPHPYEADLILRIANAEAIRSGKYSAEEALETINYILEYIALINGLTYQELAVYASNLVYGDDAELFILSEYAGLFFHVPEVIRPYDLYLLRIHLERQRAIVEALL